MAVIPVELAGRSYEVRVGSGLLADVAGAVRRRCCASTRVPVVTDANVARHWRETVDASLDRRGVRAALAGARARRRREELGACSSCWSTGCSPRKSSAATTCSRSAAG